MPSRVRQAVIVAAIAGLLVIAALGLITGAPAPDDRATALSERLRCPVCKSVSIAESSSETALAMRAEVALQVTAGRTDAQVIDYFRQRYGGWVLLDPPLSGRTVLVWVLPLVAAGAGVTLLLARLRVREAPADALPEPLRQQVNAAVERVRNTMEEVW